MGFHMFALTLGVSAKCKRSLPMRIEHGNTHKRVRERSRALWAKGGRHALGHGRHKIKGKITGLWPGWAKRVGSGVVINGTQDDVEKIDYTLRRSKKRCRNVEREVCQTTSYLELLVSIRVPSTIGDFRL